MDTQPTVRLTSSAAQRIMALLAAENDPNMKLRISITGGGCSGFQYHFSFDDLIEEDDLVIEKDGATLLVDAISYQYLLGAELDYQESLQGAQFVINNPNAKSTCGCGSSFST